MPCYFDSPSLFPPQKKWKDRSNTHDFLLPFVERNIFFACICHFATFFLPPRGAGKKGEKTEVVFGVYFFAGNGRMSPQQTRFCALDRKSLPLSKFGKCLFEAPKKCQFSAKELVQSSYTISRNIFYSYSVLLFPSRRPNLECMGGWYVAS